MLRPTKLQCAACGYPYSGKRAITQTKLTIRQSTNPNQRQKYSVATAGTASAAFSDTDKKLD